MGDEYRGRACPECGDRLSVDARRCVCGWGARKAGKGDEGPRYDMVCRWEYGALKCSYPVGLFQQGEYRGLCIFHRANDRGPDAAQVAKESLNAKPEQYLHAASLLIYRKGDNPHVAQLRASLKSTKPGNIGALSKWTPAAREPGADEMEAA